MSAVPFPTESPPSGTPGFGPASSGPSFLPQSSGATQDNPAQHSLMLGPLPIDQMRYLPLEEIAECQDFQHAINLCWENKSRRRMTRSKCAELMGVSKSTVTRMLEQGKQLTPENVEAFQLVCRNLAYNQYCDYRVGAQSLPRPRTAQDYAMQRVA